MIFTAIQLFSVKFFKKLVQERLAAAQARPPPGPTHHRAAAARKYERTPYPYPLIQPNSNP